MAPPRAVVVAIVIAAVFAVIGAKGGVGATTIAVNLAEAMARSAGDALLMDLHVCTGDAAVFLGADPRFTILDALENIQRLDEAFPKERLQRFVANGGWDPDAAGQER